MRARIGRLAKLLIAAYAVLLLLDGERAAAEDGRAALSDRSEHAAMPAMKAAQRGGRRAEPWLRV
ncbi:MAG TPA: hypothetical protein VFI42_03185 [Thermomicrobiaceae bacterium]|nr:hypothetical protein [Thermomicrobiaceae bacterium]